MTTLHFNFNDNEFLNKVARAAFPGYTGRKLRVQYGVKSMNLYSEWSGGSKDTHVLVDLASMRTMQSPATTPFRPNDVPTVELFEGMVVVTHVRFCGKDLGLVVHTCIEAPMLASGEDDELNEVDKRVIEVHNGLKSAYRMEELTYQPSWSSKKALTKAQVEQSRTKLIELGYMSKNTALTTKGKNVAEMLRKR